jgi:crotonobetainyl-CoA:carnitine CoA-transferase CaiB-like acyl-CoA transferase
MLSPYRVLDLTDDRAALGPMILRSLGAEVLRIVPPGSAGPQDRIDLADLRSRFYNQGKQTQALDLETEAGQAELRRHVAGADFLFENAAPGAMAARGLSYEALSRINPRLIHVAVTPFGQDGPYAGHAASDLTLAAMGGMVAVTGDPDRPPVRISIPQAWLHASAESAVGALVAHHLRERGGRGRFVDVSVQAAVFWTTLNASIAAAIQGHNIERNGTALPLGTILLRTTFPCADGNVVIVPNGGLLARLVPWMVEDGVVPSSWLEDEDWATYDVRLLSGQSVAHAYGDVLDRLEAFILRQTKQDFLDFSLRTGEFIAPVNTVADALDFRHLEARRYWQAMALPDGRTIRAPGPFVRSAPAAGGVPSSTFPDPTPVDPARTVEPGAGDQDLPFAGLKVADFSWVGVGPITGKYLADHGAMVVRVETAKHPDTLRVAGPFKDGIFGPNRSQFFGAFNTSKWSITLDLKQPAGQAVARRLLAWADVCLESFTPGTAGDLGFGYEAARKINPGIIMASTCLMGQTGPAAALAGYGTHAAAVSGFSEVTGWPDRPPSGPYVAYTDTIAPRFLAATIMAALDHRRRTGEGCYIEQSQMESALYFLAPEILDYQVSGALPRRAGNESPSDAPHNIYPCAGQDQWCAIAVETDDQWQALRRLLGDSPWAMDPALQSAGGRLAARDTIDAGIVEWTRGRTPYEVMDALQSVGVPAGAVQRSSDLLEDPQLRHRHFFRTHRHCEMGEVPYEGHQFRISDYDSGPRFAAPCLGEQSIEVMRDVLGMTDDEIAEVASSGALA